MKMKVPAVSDTPVDQEAVERAIEHLGQLAIRGACDARTIKTPHDPGVREHWRKQAAQILDGAGLLSPAQPELTREQMQMLLWAMDQCSWGRDKIPAETIRSKLRSALSPIGRGE